MRCYVQGRDYATGPEIGMMADGMREKLPGLSKLGDPAKFEHCKVEGLH